ncbi:MAG TPA: hypothetical protein P5328_00250 [Candidatus Paceibacterota bacterium]|nr:hypothetical protein [Candidatus Paceibacterota bacterium]HRZ34242.1 hypothetical protein [Candidatus Paceibacterota bacterium]
MSNTFSRKIAGCLSPILTFVLVFSFVSIYNPRMASAQSSSGSVLDPYTRDSDSDTASAIATGVGAVAARCLSTLAANMVSSWIVNFMGNAIQEVASSILSLEVPVREGLFRNKETGRIGTPSTDGIANCIMNGLIEAILVDTTRWVQTGAHGSPLFLENPQQFFTDLADEEFGKAVNTLVFGTTSGATLCEPFQISIKLNLLSGQQMRKKEDVCTLSEITDNMEEFIEGDFEKGGWRGWFELSQINNPEIAEYEIERDAIAAAGAKANALKMELNWGNGFLGPRDEDGTLKWPGKLLVEKISKISGIPEDKMAFADEFDELMTAVVDLLVTKAFNMFQGGPISL